MKASEKDLYRRIKLLGEGSFGKAYLVECIIDKTLCVIKQVDLNQMKEEERRETFKEARILEALRHPNIVKFREVYKTKQGRLCIVMDYADGGDMSQRLKEAQKSSISELQILDWFTQLCLALKHVHDRKIIHRDLKTQNIFLTKEGIVKMGDFGIARVLNHTREKCKTMVGTPYYLSPEIIDSKDYSFKTDIWSLGVILYEMCALKPPFNAESLHGLALKIVRGQYNPIPDKFSSDVKNLVKTLLNVDPQRRPTIHEVLKMPVIVNRIRSVLSESVRNLEFSHTILHKQNFVKTNLIVPYDEDLVRQKNQAHSQPIIKQLNNLPYQQLNNQPSQQLQKQRIQAPQLQPFNVLDYQKQQPQYGVYPASYLPQPQQQDRYCPYQNRYNIINKQNDVSPIRNQYGGQRQVDIYQDKDKSPIDRQVKHQMNDQVYLARQAVNNKKIEPPISLLENGNNRYGGLQRDPYVQKSPLQRIQEAQVQLQKIPTKEPVIDKPQSVQLPVATPIIVTVTHQSAPQQEQVEDTRMKDSHLILKEIRQDKRQELDDERKKMKRDIQTKRSTLRQNKENEDVQLDWQSNVSNQQELPQNDSKDTLNISKDPSPQSSKEESQVEQEQEDDAFQILAELEEIINQAENLVQSQVISIEETADILNLDVSDREDGQSFDDEDNEDARLPKSQESQCELVRRILEEELGYEELENQLNLIKQDNQLCIINSLKADNQWGALILMLEAMESQSINNLNELDV